MKLVVILGIALAGLAAADDAQPDPSPVAAEIRRLGPTPWMGLNFRPLEDAVRAQVPGLPRGIGFMVASVEPGGPADLAGVKRHDIFWKLGDQWIANGDQLLTLLQLQREGAEVKLGLFRSGEPLTLPLTLGRAPDGRLLQRGRAPAGGGEMDVPMKVLKPAEGSAEITEADGSAVLTLVAGQPEVKIISASGAVIYAGPVYDLDGGSLVPEAWTVRVGVLEKGLAHAMETKRPARTRVLPAPVDTTD